MSVFATTALLRCDNQAKDLSSMVRRECIPTLERGSKPLTASSPNASIGDPLGINDMIITAGKWILTLRDIS